MNMKTKKIIEKEHFKAINKKELLSMKSSGFDVLKNSERIKVLEWILSDKDDDLYEILDNTIYK